MHVRVRIHIYIYIIYIHADTHLSCFTFNKCFSLHFYLLNNHHFFLELVCVCVCVYVFVYISLLNIRSIFFGEDKVFLLNANINIVSITFIPRMIEVKVDQQGNSSLIMAVLLLPSSTATFPQIEWNYILLFELNGLLYIL